MTTANPPVIRHRRKPGRTRAGEIIVHMVGVLVLIVLIFPVYWMLSTSFKGTGDILTLTPKWFPWPGGTIDNYVRALNADNFLTDAKNSVFAAGGTVIISIILAFLAAAAVARFKFYGRRFFLGLLITTQMVPLTSLAIPLFLGLRTLGLLNEIPGLIFAYAAFVMPFCVWTLRGYIMGIPVDLEEAAMVDGCSRFGAFRRVLLPLVAPGLVATAVFAFIQAWNDYLFPLVLTQTKNKNTMTVWLASFQSNPNNSTDYGGLMAASVLFSLPVVILFLIVQRKVVAGLTAGAVKG